MSAQPCSAEAVTLPFSFPTVKDKAEILLQVDESQSIKNELTVQVSAVGSAGCFLRLF